MKKLTIHARVGHDGHEIYAFSLKCETSCSLDVRLTGNILNNKRDKALAVIDGRIEGGILSITVKDDVMRIDVVPFSVNCPFKLTVGDITYTPEDADIITDWADRFVAIEDGEVKYRLYSPESAGTRPLILFLHGGGESGSDNKIQIYQCFGAAKLAETHPDCYVLAPQAPNGARPEDLTKFLGKMTFASSDKGPGNAWRREYLAKVCDIIRQMINEGKIDSHRIYVTGMSMGGAGTLRMLNVGGDLFAAAVAICPSMTPETYNILKGLTDTKIWVTCSYLDHTPYRHKYIVDAIMSLRDGGNKEAHLTMFSPEDLEKYGISIIDDMTLEEKAGWNHACWVPTYYDEYGVISWMLNQKKK